MATLDGVSRGKQPNKKVERRLAFNEHKSYPTLFRTEEAEGEAATERSPVNAPRQTRARLPSPTLPCVGDEVNAVASAAPNAELSLDPNPTLVAAKAVPQFDANCGTAQLALLVQALAPYFPLYCSAAVCV